MSTRCCLNIKQEGKDDIVLYRHCDGYPDGEHGVIEQVVNALLKDVFDEVTDDLHVDVAYHYILVVQQVK